MFALKAIVSGVVAMTLLSGCAATSITQAQMSKTVNDRVGSAMNKFQEETAPAARVAIVDENPVDFVKTAEPEIKGDVTLKMSSAAFGPIVSELAKQKGYSLVFGDNVDVLRKVTLNFDRVFSEEAIRTIALTAGYVAVFDKSSKTIYVSETGSYVFRLPPTVFNKLVAEYDVGGDATGSGSSDSSSGGSGGSGGSSMKTEFKITGDTKSEQDTVKDFLKSVAGPTTKISVTKAGYVHVSGTAQGIKRVHDFLKPFVREAMAQVVVDASIVEVALSDSFDAGIQWGKVIDKATSGAFINGSSALGSGLAAAGSAGGSTANMVSSIASAAGAGSASGAINLYRVGASSTSIIKALKTYSDTNVVSNPKLYATSGTPATYFDGKEIPYLASIEKTAATANTGASESGKIAFAVSGTSFSIIPNVLDDKTVSMTVLPVMSETGEYETFMANQKVPSTSKRNSFNSIVLETNKTLILGGLRVTNNSKSTTLAANTASNNTTREVVILLRVSIERPSRDFQILVSESI